MMTSSIHPPPERRNPVMPDTPPESTRAGLAPITNSAARVLILGSFPGRRSLEEQRYYAHGQNRFWRAMERITSMPSSAPYDERIAALRASGVALWDVLASCERRGSLDADIVRGSEEPNDFATFLDAHPALRGVCFNGRAAAALFSRHVLPDTYWEDTGLLFLALPSTSPAHASIGVDALAARWFDALAPLLGVSTRR